MATDTWEWSIINVARSFHFGIGVKQDADSAVYYYKASLEKFPDNVQVKQAIDKLSESDDYEIVGTF